MATATAPSPRDPAGDWQDFSGFQPTSEPSGCCLEPSETAAGVERGPWDGRGDLGTELPLCFQPARLLAEHCLDPEALLPPQPLSERSALHEDE